MVDSLLLASLLLIVSGCVVTETEARDSSGKERTKDCRNVRWRTRGARAGGPRSLASNATTPSDSFDRTLPWSRSRDSYKYVETTACERDRPKLKGA